MNRRLGPDIAKDQRVLGLDHVGSTNEVMYPSLTSLDRMGPGDTWGAHALGRGSPCVDLAGGHRWAAVG